ncbi:hypothetical protein [Paraglaciecola hydrolytica]|uniref:Uncharacterized protein n=1 Tax=Paraglaciecola hydrolytica TaxID=1799789 RepID=A0A136A4Y8_9ALTE|nr:hypothetical protein [Paraglaciecola hydrolytica]KXI30276.1 hypothetical protein AX660_09850 [Paraglaciecola hydrolytica]
MKSIYLILAMLLSSTALAHQGHIEDAAMLACTDKQVNDACEYQNQVADRYKGNCRLILEAMMCVRNQPIERSNSIFHQISEPLLSHQHQLETSKTIQ